MPSGRTLSCSNANQAPVRPSPDCTSSRISSTRCASQSARTPASQPSGGTMMPASPWIGSTSTAAVSGVIARSMAARSPNGTARKPGANGPKPSR